METVRFESEPPGAEAKVSNGQACRTPCALALPATGSYAVTFTLNGYQPASDQIEMASMGDNTQTLQPNPVLAELTPAAPPPPAKKPARNKPAAKPAPKPTARGNPTTAAVPSAPAPTQQQAPSPWPSAPSAR